MQRHGAMRHQRFAIIYIVVVVKAFEVEMTKRTSEQGSKLPGSLFLNKNCKDNDVAIQQRVAA